SLLQNPIVLGGVGVMLIAIIVAAMILLRRRRQQSDDIGEEDFQPMLIDDNDTIAPGESVNVVDEASAADEEEEEVTQQTSDVIGEAEIYIAYGRFPQAISFLQNAIESEPARADIQLKLLEVYVQTEDATAFNLQFDQLKLLNDEAATAEALQLQAQIPGAAESSAAAMDATIVSSEPIAA
ncbi:MAG: peptigoglycan-binding protein LysM, partial [Gammaproteobacteria bacterium]